MNNEGFGGRNSQDIRKGRDYMLPGWEDADQKDTNEAYDHLKEELEEHGVTLDAGTKLLEIGSGKGLMLEKFKREGIDVVGVDARPGRDSAIDQVAARAERLPFADQIFDVVNSNFAFDANAYNQDQNLMLKEIARVLKENGLFVNWGRSLEGNDPNLVLVSHPEKHWAQTFQKRSQQ